MAVNMCDILDGGAFIGVVNAPDLGAIAKLEHAAPYVKLAERIGSMHGQLLQNSKIGSITVNLRGKDVADPKLLAVIKSAVIKGALSELGVSELSYVSALDVAEEMGLRVLVNTSEVTEAGSGYRNSLGVELQLEGVFNCTRTIEGTVFGRDELRITKIDGFSVELPPGEHVLLWNNFDEPGVLKRIMDRLAQDNINVAHFSVGRKQRGERAMGAVVLDTPVSAELLAALGREDNLCNVIQLRLKETIDPNFRARCSDE